jgi:hypothetical protein
MLMPRGNVLVPTHPIGNIPTLCQKEIFRQNCTTGNIPTQKKAVGTFPVGQQEISRHNFGQQEMSRQQKTLSGYFLLANRKCSDSIFAVGTFPIAQQEISRQSCSKYMADTGRYNINDIISYHYITFSMI